LFTAAKISQMAMLPQGAPMREERVKRMVTQMDREGFGNCTNIGECREGGMGGAESSQRQRSGLN
jgi:succinate dehydrogenase / fumarate reductase iron-sulfur subunit